MKNKKQASIHKILSLSCLLFVILTAAVVIAYRSAKKRTPTIVLPGGITYLGPSPTFAPAQPGKVSIPTNDQWVEYRGKVFPYSFQHPKSLSIGFFPDDPFDGVTVFLPNTKPEDNLFLRVEDLTKISEAKDYVGKSKREYAENWWRQYPAWTSVVSVTAFTNSQGLKGYRAKYLDAAGTSPYDHVFFEVYGKQNLVLWLSGRLLPQEVFDRLIDSLAWNSTP